jgi:ArpU family phage transcriptional regulator
MSKELMTERIMYSSSLNFEPLNIDYAATRKVVKKALEKYRMFLLSEKKEYHPRITSDFSFTPPTRTNQFHSSTESAAIANIDRERERSAYIETISNAVNRLELLERTLLIRRYLTKEDIYDFEIYPELGLGKTKYHSVKNQAMVNLALVLKIEVYKE